MIVKRLRALVLTPVHVGTGEKIAPEDYFVQDDTLVRFHPAAVFRAMSPAELQKFEALIARDQLHEAWSALREKARGVPGSEMYRVKLGKGAREGLKSLVSNPQRRGDVGVLARNPYTSKVVVPGSSIKGAIRTALINHRLQESGLAAGMSSEVDRAGARELSRLAGDMERKVLGYQSGEMERDPFRLLSVRDASLPASAARVDLVKAVSRRTEAEQPDKGIPMHVERLVSLADGHTKPVFEFEVVLASEAASHPRVREYLRRPITWEELVRACRTFYEARWKAERAAYPVWYRSAPADGWWQVPEGGFLLRIGRYSHFESLSVDGLRRAENRQTHQWMREGTSRTVCELEPGGKAPFGWLRVQPVG